ncbi:MAG: hypothetical protein PHY28_09120 [Dehalococcoidales bacterium]|nr:hypothetical protein [Dehalococcoidales bacterium]
MGANPNIILCAPAAAIRALFEDSDARIGMATGYLGSRISGEE